MTKNKDFLQKNNGVYDLFINGIKAGVLYEYQVKGMKFLLEKGGHIDYRESQNLLKAIPFDKNN